MSSSAETSILSLLCSGKWPSGEEVAKVLRHVIRRLRNHWPGVAILVRGDSDYCSEPALALLETMRCDYIRLRCQFQAAGDRSSLARAMRLATRLHEPAVRRFHQLAYRAREWSWPRKLVARVEVTALGTDVRFIVTSLEGRGKTL